ncbi:MAG: hypothetical protein JSW34_00310 [Candidatus Zixiibacteriota bacterium]|nr:MAG: hypothetical protein JSW34_00310 [candidate division Zixibacteria bacterium]
MDYGRLVTRSFEIAWKYKSLWIFGLFAGGGWSNLNFDIPTRKSYSFDTPGLENILDISPEKIVMFAIAVVTVIVVMILLSFISEAALIDSVNRIDRGGRYRFMDAFSTGIDFFLRFLGVFLLGVFTGIVFTAILALAAVIFFKIHTAMGILSLLAIIPLFLLGSFAIFSLIVLTQRVMVVRNVSIGDALEEAYLLFRRNLSKTAIVFLIYIGLAILLGIAAVIIWAIFSIPIAALGLAAHMEPISAFFAALIVGLPVSLVLGGFLGVFFSSLYTLFYFQLVEPKGVAAPQTPPASATV